MSNSAFGFEKPEDSPGLSLWQTTIIWQRLIKQALEPHGISHAQHVIMAILLWFKEKNEEPTQILMVRLSKLDKMTVSKALKKLVNLGLVKRFENKQDTRAKSVHLTTPGKKLAQRLVPIVEKIDAEFFGVLNKNEQVDIVKILGKLIAKSNE